MMAGECDGSLPKIQGSLLGCSRALPCLLCRKEQATGQQILTPVSHSRLRLLHASLCRTEELWMEQHWPTQMHHFPLPLVTLVVHQHRAQQPHFENSEVCPQVHCQ